MAGPGGGPSRRSHTKSRKGCKTCKRRHIRCDETFPQCRNCTKHQCRCDYMDSPTATGEESPASPSQPNLLWTPEIERIVGLWRQTGEYPFPELAVYPQPQWHLYSKAELRLIHHLSSIASEMHRNKTSRLTIWTEFLPRFLSIAASQPFVMHSILAFSASHLAWISQSNETRRLALHFSSEAFRGLQQAISNFSKANADAVLAASLILSWQATEWRGWNFIMTGKRAIVAAMQTWKGESLFADYLARQDLDAQPSFTNNGSYHMTPEARQEHLAILQHVQSSLVRLQPYLINHEQENEWIEQLKGYIDRIRASNPPRTPEEQFGQLYPLRKWLFWIPVSLLTARKGDVFTLIVLANFYAAALAIEPLFPDIGAPFCANMALPPLDEIIRITNQLHSIQGYNQATQAAIMLMKAPQEIASNFHSRREWARQHAESLQAITSGSYGLDALSLDLDTPFSEFGYGQSLSPAFPPSPLHPSPANSAVSAPGSGSPYLEVPRSSIDYSSGSAYATPLSSPAAPPLAYTQEESFFNYGVSSSFGYPGGELPQLQIEHPNNEGKGKGRQGSS